jgi:hypothetical protein
MNVCSANKLPAPSSVARTVKLALVSPSGIHANAPVSGSIVALAGPLR